MAQAKPQAEPGIDMRSLFQKLEFEPHSPAQWEYCESDARFNIPCCGRRWGKSIATGHRATYKSFIPDSYTWIVGPTYKLAEKEFRVVFKDYEKLGLLPYCKKQYQVNQGSMRIETPWGAIIEAVSAEKPDSLLGEGLSHAVMSESAKHTRTAWEQYIEPALSDLLGSCDFPSTPQGFNWYHGLWMLGQGLNDNYKSWSFPTWTNPIRYPGGLDNDEIKRIRSVVSKVYFEQEYGAQFTSLAGAIYEEWDERIHVRPHKFRPDWPNYLALDYGFVNPFVCLDIQIGPDDHAYVWREYYKSYISTYEHGIALASRDNPPGYRIDDAWGDPRGADEAATLGQVFRYINSADVPWKLGVEQIKRMLKPDESGEVHLSVDPSCLNLIRQMNQLHVKMIARAQQAVDEHRADGNIQHKVDDHAADALRYFVSPYFVLGANIHLADVYGNQYMGSESQDFLSTHLDNSVTMGDSFDRPGALSNFKG